MHTLFSQINCGLCEVGEVSYDFFCILTEFGTVLHTVVVKSLFDVSEYCDHINLLRLQ